MLGLDKGCPDRPKNRPPLFIFPHTFAPLLLVRTSPSCPHIIIYPSSTLHETRERVKSMSSFFENAFASFKSWFGGSAPKSKGGKGGRKSPPSTPRRGTRRSARSKNPTLKAREAANSEDEVKKLRKVASPKKKGKAGVSRSFLACVACSIFANSKTGTLERESERARAGDDIDRFSPVALPLAEEEEQEDADQTWQGEEDDAGEEAEVSGEEEEVTGQACHSCRSNEAHAHSCEANDDDSWALGKAFQECVCPEEGDAEQVAGQGVCV